MFSMTSRKAAPAQLRNSSAPSSRRTTHSAKILGAAAIALLAAGNTLANAAENPAQLASKQHACAVVMGLHRPGDLYDTCIRSLSKSLSELHQVRVEERDRSACAQSGHTPGTPAFAVCVLTADQSPVDAGRH
jgi:hypothetical protein